MPATIDREFADSLLATFDDPAAHGVHLLFNEFWSKAPQEVIDGYVEVLNSDPEFPAWVAEGHYAEGLKIERLAECGEGTLGAAMHTFVLDNGLEANLAMNYRQFHEALVEGGVLDGMPDDLQYAILRGFQMHDFMHVITGYGPSSRDEILVQAFCLAQMQFPYFAMWISVVTTRNAFIGPEAIVPVMDAITEGWTLGRNIENLQYERLEDLLDEPLVEVRKRYGIAPEGRAVLVPAPA